MFYSVLYHQWAYTMLLSYCMILTTGFQRNGKEANNYNCTICYIMASLSCASILCAVVLLITNGSIRHAVELIVAVAIWVQPSASKATENHPDVSQRVCRFGTCSVSLSRAEAYAVDCHCAADLRGGLFPRHIFAYCQRIFVADFRGGFPRRILRRIWVNHAADFVADLFQVQNPVNYISKSHRKSTKIHRILHRMLA